MRASTPPDGSGAAADFAATAARLCTTVVNEHYVPLDVLDDGEVLIGVLEAGTERPDQVTIDSWVADLDAGIAAWTAARSALGQLESGDPASEAAWTTIVESADADAARDEERRDLLANADWAAVVEGFRPGPGASADGPSVEDALDVLGLRGSDCSAPYSRRHSVADPSRRRFVVAAAVACTEVVARRLDGRLAAGSRTVLDYLAQIHDDPAAAVEPEGIADALARIAAEWRLTANDLIGVDAASSPEPALWDAVVDAARERADVAEARLAAVGDPTDPAFELGPYEHPALPFDQIPAGQAPLSARSCGGIES